MRTLKEAHDEMFDVFCNLHPHEAYVLDSEGFIRHCKNLNPEVTEEDIINLLKETE
jgi:hypothetical protein